MENSIIIENINILKELKKDMIKQYITKETSSAVLMNNIEKVCKCILSLEKYEQYNEKT